MKKIISTVIPLIILIAMILALIPAISVRTENEAANKNVAVSLLYNDIANKVSDTKLDEIMAKSIDIGISLASVMEDDVNSLVARGEVTCIKYNVLMHKSDDESIRVAEAIREQYPDISFDSYIVLAKRDEGKTRGAL